MIRLAEFMRGCEHVLTFVKWILVQGLITVLYAKEVVEIALKLVFNPYVP